MIVAGVRTTENIFDIVDFSTTKRIKNITMCIARCLEDDTAFLTHKNRFSRTR